MVVGLVLSVALLLTGCGEVGSLVTKAGIDLGLQKLTSQLEEIPSVATVTPIAEITVDFGYTVTLHVLVDGLVEQDLLDIVEAVTETFTSDAFAATESLLFGIEAPDGALLTMSESFTISPEEMKNDIHYWVELSAVYGGPLSMEVWTGRRSIRAMDEGPTVDWAALRAVPDTSTGIRQWEIGGLFFTEFPSDAVLELRDQLAGLASADDEWVALGEYSPGYSSVQFLSPDLLDLDDAATSTAWPRVLAAVSLIAAATSTVGSVTFTYSGYDNVAGSVHLGECEGETVAAPEDALWEALATSNLDLPAGSGAGFCSHA
jgi:hypothetical protein